MLESLRKAAGTWVAKLLLILLVLSFAVWGISGSMLGQTGDTVVSVGDTKVSAVDYRLAYDRQVNVMSQQFGQRLTREQATALGVDGQVLSQLIAGALLDEQARLMGLGVSKDRVAQLTAEDEAFHGPDGAFNRQQFDFVLRQIGMRPEDYLRNRQQVAVRQQIVEAVSDGIAMPQAFLRAVALYQGEDRTAEYLVLPRSLVEPIADPDDATLTAYFDANKSTYDAPEFRKIAYVKLEPSDIADPEAITDEQVAEDYERGKSKFTTPETRTIQQLVFANEEAANLAMARLRGGDTFEDLMRAEGKSEADVSLGTLEKARVGDPAVADAAFALEQNAVSGIVAGAFGPVIVRVTQINPEVVRPLAEVSAQIREELALAEASRILLDVHDRYEDSRAAGETLAEAARKLNLDVETIEAVDRQARGPDGEVIDGIPESAALLREAFQTEPNVENPAINIGSTGFLFYEVESVTPTRQRTLDEVRERVVADWKEAEAASRLSARAQDVEKRLRDGAQMATIATELSLEVQTKRGLKRGAEDPDLGAAGVDAVFAVADGGVGTVGAPTGGARIVFKVIESFEPVGAGPESVPEQNRTAFASGLSDDLLDQLVARLQGEYGVSVNQAAIAQALAF